MLTVFTRIWPEVREYKRRIIVSFALGLVASALHTFIPNCLRRLVDAWTLRQDQDILWWMPIVLAALWITKSAFQFGNVYLMKYTSDLMMLNLRRKLMNKYLSLNLSFFQSVERGSGGLISRMLNDFAIIQAGVHKAADVIREPFTIIGLFGFLLYMNWQLTLFVLIPVPIVSAALRKLAGSLRKYSRVNQEAMEGIASTLKESLDGTRIVQSFCLEDEMSRRFEVQANRFIETRKKIIGREEAAGPVSESITVLFIACILLYIGYLVLKTDFTMGDFMGFIVSLASLLDAIRKVQDGYIKMQQASIAFSRLYEVLDTHPPIKDSATTIPFPENWQEIEFRNVTFSFGTETILKKINLKLRRGETIALVGSSGSGKTTLVNLLQRFFDPDSGEILIGGVSIQQMALKDLRKHVALVTQDVFLFNDTIEKNIQLGREGSTFPEVEYASKMANAHDFILKTPAGYKTSVGDFGNRMSGGEKQRISIARAILKNSPILVLDEATSALDSESEFEVQKGLQQLLVGRTAFVIAHRLSTIAKADRIIVLRKGEIVEEGGHDDLLQKKGEYFKFHQIQSIP